jgi:hypothetical protein
MHGDRHGGRFAATVSLSSFAIRISLAQRRPSGVAKARNFDGRSVITKFAYLAQKIRVWVLLDQRPQVHHLLGHRCFLESGWCQQPDPIERIIDDHRKAARPTTALL